MFGFKIFRRLVSAAILLVVVLPFFALGKIWVAGHYPAPRKSDVIVVLGAAQFDGRPSEVLLARLSQAKKAFNDGLALVIITVGSGAPGDRTTEAAAGRKWLIENGVKVNAVIAVEKGRDTYASTQGYVAEMKKLRAKSALIVTDPYHCLRAITMAHDLGVSGSCSPVHTGPNSLLNFDFHYLFRETSAYLAYVTLGRKGIHVSDHLGQA